MTPLDALRYSLGWAWWEFIARCGGPRHHSYGYARWRAYCCAAAVRAYLHAGAK